MEGSQSNDAEAGAADRADTQREAGQTSASRPSSSRHRSHSSRSGRSGRSSRSNHSHRPSLSRRLSKRERTLFGALLILPWLICLGVIAWHGYSTFRTGKERGDILSRLEEAQQKLRAALTENETLRSEMTDMVEGRLPGDLHPMDFDQVINIDDGLTKNVLFTELRRERQQGYEYRIVLENGREERIQPHVRILVFDRLGIQIGTADITQSPDWEDLAAVGLGSGESHSFSGGIQLTMDRKPAYFMITTSVERFPGV